MLLRRITSQSHLRLVFYGLCGVLLVILVGREHRAFADSLNTVSKVSPNWTLAGFGIMIVSVMASSGLYGVLSPKKLRFSRTLFVQLGSMGINRLLPAGSGALGVSYVYLRANKITKPMAAAVVATNNLLGFIGHALLLSLGLLFYPSVIQKFGVSGGKFRLFLVAAGLLVVVSLIILITGRRAGKLKEPLQPFLKRPRRFLIALGLSMVITVCYGVIVLLAAAAMGVDLSPVAALLVLSFGVAAASAVPTPGGIGAAEAGIFAGLHAYGVATDTALSVAILYRVMTFWLPLLIGGLVFVVVERRGYLRTSS